MQLGSSTFRGTAMPSAAARVAAPRAAVAFTPVRASQSLQGTVISTAGAKTAVVAVDRMVVHPVYKKRVNFTTKYTAHDETNQCKVGDIVTLTPTRPLSKSKRFLVEAVVKASS